MKAMDFVVLSGSASAAPPDWILPLLWVAVALTALLITMLVAWVFVRTIRLWRRLGVWPRVGLTNGFLEPETGRYITRLIKNHDTGTLSQSLSPDPQVLELLEPHIGDQP